MKRSEIIKRAEPFRENWFHARDYRLNTVERALAQMGLEIRPILPTLDETTIEAQREELEIERDKLNKFLYLVDTKIPGQSRYQTALNIMEAATKGRDDMPGECSKEETIK